MKRVFFGGIFSFKGGLYSLVFLLFSAAPLLVWGVGPLDTTFKNVLIGFAQTLGYISVAGAGLFVYVLNADSVNMFLDAPIIPVMWAMVRDFLNLIFILVLLFSAFATIFQVERFHLRNILIRLVIMALLVNFSLPVARVIVDAGNITMYFFVDRLFPDVVQGSGQAMSAMFGKYINIADILLPNPDPATMDYTYLFVAIVFTFVYGILLLVIAGILVVRLVALVILMIFSPIGFVASILPNTAQFASRWWSALFKYTFNGPILIFILFFSLQFMGYIHSGTYDLNNTSNNLQQSIQAASNNQATYITDIAFLIIPIVIMTMGIAAAMSGADGASSYIYNLGNKAIQKTARGLRGGGYYVASEVGRAGDVATGRIFTGAVRSVGLRAKRRADRREAARNRRAAQLAVPLSLRGMGERIRSVGIEDFSRRVAEASKELQHFTNAGLERMINYGNRQEVAAAMSTLADRNSLDLEHLERGLDRLGDGADTAQVRANLEKALRKENRGTLIAYEVNNNRRVSFDDNYRPQEVRSVQEAINRHLDITASQLGQQRDLDILINRPDIRREVTNYIDANVVTNLETAKNASRNANVETREHLTQLSDNFRQNIGQI